MAIGLDLAQVVARLQAQVAALKKVGTAVDLGSAQEDLKNKLPACYVVPFAEVALGNALENAVSQQVNEDFSVVYAISNLRDVRGEAASADLRPIRGSVQTALLGWTYDANAYDPFIFVRGRLLALTNPVLWWIDTYRTVRYARAT